MDQGKINCAVFLDIKNQPWNTIKKMNDNNFGFSGKELYKMV